jgi:hypothetical protein
MQCVVCGQPTGDNHRCPKRVESAWQAKQTRALNAETFYHETPQLAEHIRLFAGLCEMERDEW